MRYLFKVGPCLGESRSKIITDRFKLGGIKEGRYSQCLQGLRVVSPFHLSMGGPHHILPNRYDFPDTATGTKFTVALSFDYLTLSSPHWRSPELKPFLP